MAISVSAQLMRSEELEKYAKEKFGDKWENAAANIEIGRASCRERV